MYQDYSQYLQWLQMCIQTQENRINVLEETIRKMREEIKQLTERQSIHVERIEYKFDQLKVETLDGTLNIGLNPSDLSSSIEDFAVQNKAISTPVSPQDQMQRSMKIEEAIYTYLETDLPHVIKDTQQRLNILPNEDYLSFIKQDIMKQLPSRIDYYMKNAQVNRSPENENEFEQNVIEALKQEIANGVFLFLNNLPENLKGRKTE